MKGWCVLIGFSVAGEWVTHWLRLPVPGGFVGMVLLLVVLGLRSRVAPQVQAPSQHLLQNMMLLFIPLIAGIMDQTAHIRSHWIAFVASCVLGAVLTLLTTAWVLQAMLRRQRATQSINMSRSPSRHDHST